MKDLIRVAIVFLVEVGFIGWKLGPHFRSALRKEPEAKRGSTPPMDNEAWGDRARASRQGNGYSSDEWE